MEIEVFFDGKKQVNAKVGKHIIKTDQPLIGGGEDLAPTPYELFLASMATCAGIFVNGFCSNRGIPTEGITLTQSHSFDDKGYASIIEIMINLPEGFPEKYVDSVVHVANLCKVKQQMSNPPQMSVKAKIGK